MDQDLAIPSLDRDVDENHFVDPIVIPFVVGSHLVDPLGDASVHITGPNGHRPPVIAWALHRVPSAGVA